MVPSKSTMDKSTLNTVLAPKDNGGTRVTVNMRNKAIQPIPIPRVEEIKIRFLK